jgi:hypothetical protein
MISEPENENALTLVSAFQIADKVLAKSGDF